MIDADHEESSPDAATLLISRLACSLVGQTEAVKLVTATQAATLYQQAESTEDFLCNYGFNAAFTERFQGGALQFVGFDADGALRIVELPDHPFFMATLFLPQMRSQSESPHPLIKAYLQAASTV